MTPSLPMESDPLERRLSDLIEDIRKARLRERRHDTKLALIERDLMSAEYQLDSTVSHVRRKGCNDIRPFALARIQAGLEKVRVARERVRRLQGNRQWTLFAGSANPADPTQRQIKQKPWSHKTAHKWKKDCDGAQSGD